MKQKASKVLLWVMIGITVVWAIFLLSFFSTDGILEFWAWGLLVIITAPEIVSVLVIFGIIRSSLNGKSLEQDMIMYRFNMSMMVASAVLTLTAVAVRFLLDGDKISLELHISQFVDGKMWLAFSVITFVSLFIGVLASL